MKSPIKQLNLLHFLNDGIRVAFIALLVYVARDLHLNYSQIGFLGSSQAMASAIMAFPSGYILAKSGGFKVLTGLLVIYSLGALSASISPNFLLLTISYMIGALGFGMFHTTGFVLIAKLSQKNNIGRNMGSFTAIGDIGRIAIPPLALYISSLIGWRPTIAAIGVGGMTTYLVLRRLFKPSEESKSVKQEFEHETIRTFLNHTLVILKAKQTLWVLLAVGIDSFASSAVFVYLPFLLILKGIDAVGLGIVTAGFFAGSLAGKYFLGKAVDTSSNKKVFIFSEIAMSILLVLLATTSFLPVIVLIAFLLGGFTKGTSPVIQTMFSQLTHHSHYNKMFTLSEFFISLAAMTTVMLMGIVADKFGVQSVFNVIAVLGITSIIPMSFVKLNNSRD